MYFFSMALLPILRRIQRPITQGHSSHAKSRVLGNHCRTNPDAMTYDTDGTCVDVKFLIQITD